jgi:hypothetical protein
VLQIEPDAGTEEITRAHGQLTASLDPATQADEQKKDIALARVVADTALDVLSDEGIRKTYDEKLDELQKAVASKAKIESKRAGKLQEEQSVEEDTKLQKATVKYETARSALVDFYFDRLSDRARETEFEAIPQEKLMEWISAERAEAVRKAEQKGRRTSFRIDWEGFASVQDKRKGRGDDVTEIVERLVEELHLP